MAETDLLRPRDCFDRSAERNRRPGLHLAEDERPSATDDQVELDIGFVPLQILSTHGSKTTTRKGVTRRPLFLEAKPARSPSRPPCSGGWGRTRGCPTSSNGCRP